jgi:chromosome segregation ATPase
MSQLQKQVDDNRQKILDEREKFLANAETAFRQKIAKEPELQQRLGVLDSQLKAKQAALASAQDKGADAVTGVRAFIQNLEHQQANVERKIFELEVRLRDKKTKLEQLSTEVKTKNDELRAITVKAHDANTYLVDQEDTVNKAIADWNARLTELAKEAEVEEKRKNVLLTENFHFEQKKAKFESELNGLQERLVIQEKSMSKSKQDLDDSLKKEQFLVRQSQAKLDLTNKKNAAAEKGFVIRERALDAREKALTQRDNDLRQKERFIQSRLSMV